MSLFNEDQIAAKAHELPDDVFGLLHDLAYHHAKRLTPDYVRRAQRILRGLCGCLACSYHHPCALQRMKETGSDDERTS